jgi:putative inorganic carbon (hco3(-)) transporter
MAIYYGLLLFFVLEYVRPGVFVPGLDALRLNSIVPLCVAAMALSKPGAMSNEALFRDVNTRVLVMFLTLLVLSVLTADVTSYTIDPLMAVFGYCLIYMAMAKHLTSWEQIRGVIRLLVAIHIFILVLNPQVITSGDRSYLSGAPFLGDGNDFALSLNIVIPLCLLLLFEARKVLHRLFYLSTLLVLTFAVIATQSRGGTLALLAVGVYYWIKSDRKVVTATLAAAAVAVVLATAPPQYFDRMEDMTNTEEGSAHGRVMAWTAAVRMAMDHPVFGVGSGHFPVTYQAFYKTERNAPRITAHSIYFLVLGELGLPGLVMIVWFVVGNLMANRTLAAILSKHPDAQRRRQYHLLGATSAALIAYSVAGAFLSALYYPHMFIVAGLLTASRRLAASAAEAGSGTPATVPPEITYHWALRGVLPARRAS